MGATAGFPIRDATFQRCLNRIGFGAVLLRANIQACLLGVRFLPTFALDVGGAGFAQTPAVGTL